MGLARAKDVWPAIQSLLGLECLTRVRKATITLDPHEAVSVVVEMFADNPDQPKGALQERRFEVVELGSASEDVLIEKMNAERARRVAFVARLLGMSSWDEAADKLTPEMIECISSYTNCGRGEPI